MRPEQPGFRDPLLPMADQPGVRLNEAEEARLEHAWRLLQLGCPCEKREAVKSPPRRRGCCGGRK